MEDNSWYQGVEKEISLLKGKMSRRDYSAYELDGFLRVAKKVSNLLDECIQCAGFKETIKNGLNNLADWPDISKDQRENYIYTFRTILKHLEESHSLKQPVWRLLVPSGGLCILGGIFCFVIALGQSFMESNPPDYVDAFVILSRILFGLGFALLIFGVAYNSVKEKK